MPGAISSAQGTINIQNRIFRSHSALVAGVDSAAERIGRKLGMQLFMHGTCHHVSLLREFLQEPSQAGSGEETKLLHGLKP